MRIEAADVKPKISVKLMPTNALVALNNRIGVFKKVIFLKHFNISLKKFENFLENDFENVYFQL